MTCTILWHNKVVGHIGFNTINYVLRKVEIGYWLKSDYQGKGIMSKAVSKLTALAFEDFDMTKVQISVAVENIPSRTVCERNGFTLEGIIKNSENLHGRIVDHAIYGLYRKR